jgi:copper homeostasis protein
MCRDPLQALEDIISAGASRILTSGQKECAADGTALINRLVFEAGKRIIIMPGGGIDETNIASVVTKTKVREIHLTGRKSVDSEMVFRQSRIRMGGEAEISEFTRKIADIEKIKKIIKILKEK